MIEHKALSCTSQLLRGKRENSKKLRMSKPIKQDESNGHIPFYVEDGYKNHLSRNFLKSGTYDKQ